MSDPYAPPPPPPDPAVVGALPPSSGPYAPRDHVADGAEAMARVQAEAERARRTFTHDGQTFEFRPVVDFKVIIAMTRGNIAKALELALVGGLNDVDRLLDTQAPLSEADLSRVLEGWVQSHGTSLGE